MCINKEVSITTFIVSLFVGIYLFFRNKKYDKWLAVFLLSFSSMQLIEYFLWILQENNLFKSNYDYFLVKFVIPLVLILELLSAYLGKLWYQNNYKFNILNLLKKEFKTSIFPYILIIYIAIFIYHQYIAKFVGSSVSKQGHLNWGSTYQHKKFWTYFNGLLFAFLLAYPFFGEINIVAIYLFATVLIALFYSDNFASYWCFIGNFSVLILLLYPYFMKL